MKETEKKISLRARLRKLLFKFSLWALPITSRFISPILVYSTGKVGTTSISASLRRLHRWKPVFQVHFLSDISLDEEKQFCKQENLNLPRHAVVGLRLNRFLSRYQKRVHWKIITLVRDPLAREISALFQNMELNKTPQLTNLAGEQLVDGAITHIENYLANFDDHRDYATVWFDREIKGVFGIDLYAEKLDLSKGYQVFNHENVDLLLIRLEDLPKCAEEAFRDFLGIQKFTLAQQNMAEKKAYSDVYKKVLRKITLPDELLENIYAGRYAQTFYTEAEISDFKRRWKHIA